MAAPTTRGRATYQASQRRTGGASGRRPFSPNG